MRKDQIRAMHADDKSNGIRMTNDMERKLLEANKAEIDHIIEYGKGDMSLQDFELGLNQIEAHRMNANLDLYRNKEQQNES